MDGLIDHFRAMARNTLWANQRLLGACASLSIDGFTARRVGFFPSLSATLNHIHAVDLYYLDALEGGHNGPDLFDGLEEIRDPVILKQEQDVVDRRLVAYCDALTAEEMVGNIAKDRREHGVCVERVDAILAHLFQHQIHHRGQAHAMLSSTTILPPQLDEFFLVFDRHPEAVPLAAEVGLP